MVALVYTKEEVAELLKVKPSWIAGRCAARAIPFTMLGGSYRFTDEHIQEIIKIHERGPAVRRTPHRPQAPENITRLEPKIPPRLRKRYEESLG
ncbi:helix-turn-helix domain-containing protein [Nocardiopsis sp. TNDT3]|uniref:helix-turn-helix domain-containing protein n=1 Tax=Nocardiopsis sp. TNDT3 TaxID=2249354 RepID=UPI000E3EAD5A|nr:helix-turn-helix domain-containing protein [Nocardiopsis sp. TNDT3]